MDIVYILQHSKQANREILYSLRSVAQHLPWVRKVWILGDRPEFLTDDKEIAQHVTHQEIAWIGRWRLPVRNNFILTLMGSLIPGLSDEFIWFADDYIILKPLNESVMRERRAVEHLAEVVSPGSGLYKEAIWRTRDVLARLKYPVLNFEAHLPQTYRREWIWHAYRTFRDFVSEDRFYGMLVHTAIMNYVVKEYGLSHTMLQDEGRFLGVYPKFVAGLCADDLPREHRPPQPLAQNAKVATRLLTPRVLAAACERKYFLNFNDDSFGGVVEDYLAERFAERCKFER